MDLQALLSANLRQGLSSQQQLRALDLVKSGEKYNPTTASELASYLKNTRYEDILNKTGNQIVGNLPFNKSNILDTGTINRVANVPKTSVNFDYSNILNGVNSASSSIRANLDSLNQITAPVEQERSGLVNKMNTAIDKLLGRSQRTQELQSQYNITGDINRLKDINTQIAEKTAAFNAGMQQEEGRLAPMEVITGRQAYMKNQAAVELGNLGILAQALQGNITLSQQMVKDTVDLEYAPIEQEIANLQYQLELNADNMNRAEKKRAEALSIYLSERQSQIEEEKQTKTDIRNLAIQAVQNGASTATAQRMMQSKTLDEALGLGGEFLKEEAKTQIVDVDGRKKLINSQTGAVIQDLGLSDLPDQPSISEQLAASSAGYDIVDGQIKPKNRFQIISQSGNAYDMSTYAEDPNQAKAVQNYLNNIGKFNSIDDIDAYIKKNKPNSTITGQMIANASTNFGIGWEELTALMQHEGLLGTSNVSVKNNNPGGITWTPTYQASHPNISKGTARPSNEGGNYVKFNTMQDGVNAVAEQLSRRAITTGETLSTRAKSVYDNPLLINQYTATEKGKIIDEIANAGLDTSSLVGKALSDTAIKEITQTQSALTGLVDLQNKIKDNLEFIGPLKGLQAINPFSKARQIQADVDRIRQIVGKALEGGVLRKEDEEKYKKILATLTDQPETAEYKITQLISQLQQNINDYVELQGLSGRYVPSALDYATPNNSGLSEEQAYQEYLKLTQ